MAGEHGDGGWRFAVLAGRCEFVDQITDRLLVSRDDAFYPVVVPGLRQSAAPAR